MTAVAARSDSGPPPVSLRSQSSSATSKPTKKTAVYTAPPSVPPEKYLPAKKRVARPPDEPKPGANRTRIFGHFDDGYCITSQKLPPHYDDIVFSPRSEEQGREDKKNRRPPRREISKTVPGTSSSREKEKHNRSVKLDDYGDLSASHSSILSEVGDKVSAIQRAQQELESRLGKEYYNTSKY